MQTRQSILKELDRELKMRNRVWRGKLDLPPYKNQFEQMQAAKRLLQNLTDLEFSKAMARDKKDAPPTLF